LRKDLVVIKLGGSALTDKTRIYTPRLSAIHRAAEQLSIIQEKVQLVLVHGAGSFGHMPVKRYGLEEGYTSHGQITGLTTTKFKLLEWEKILDTILLKHGVHIVPFLASDFIETEAGRIRRADLDSLSKWLRLGCVPTVGGDIVPDSKRGFAILSGDQLAAYLAIKFKATRLVFAVDVDGVFDSDPKLNREARLLSVMTPTTARRYVAKATTGATSDVTGGMAGKITEGVVAARCGIPTYFVNLTKSSRLQRAALGQSTVSSLIRTSGGS